MPLSTRFVYFVFLDHDWLKSVFIAAVDIIQMRQFIPVTCSVTCLLSDKDYKDVTSFQLHAVSPNIARPSCPLQLLLRHRQIYRLVKVRSRKLPMLFKPSHKGFLFPESPPSRLSTKSDDGCWSTWPEHFGFLGVTDMEKEWPVISLCVTQSIQTASGLIRKLLSSLSGSTGLILNAD